MKSLRRCKDPSVLKGTAFTAEERTPCGLQVFLSPHVEPPHEQIVRAPASPWIPSYSPGQGENKAMRMSPAGDAEVRSVQPYSGIMKA